MWDGMGWDGYTDGCGERRHACGGERRRGSGPILRVGGKPTFFAAIRYGIFLAGWVGRETCALWCAGGIVVGLGFACGLCVDGALG
ncbi:hypothetical protein BZA05DRAFT_393522 [Tricharina praecox]|uniref:uncharacterized protein n=1 Tax=Tricharina praecox TaxID=43433 RepID=UPI00222046CF|nr:uncharacterized protein BZA05DRAFT_393522 [Tricharina praecox]KAI5854206.1 hypothetical protein BZA05DRAFT_393522 [Tricharina praecox]